MAQEDLPAIEQSLEELLLCGDLDDEQHELVERCIDQGYLQLEAPDKAQIRRLLNQFVSGSQRAVRPGRSALQRWRERRQKQPSVSRRPNIS